MTQNEFADFINKNMDVLPEKNNQSLDEILYWNYKKCSFRKRQEYSLIDRAPDGSLFERIFSCIEYKREGFKWQEIMAISEKYGTFSRNCFYTSYGLQSGVHVYGFRGEEYKGNCVEGYVDPIAYQDFMEESDIEPEKVYSTDLFTINDMIGLDNSLKYCAWHNNFNIRASAYIRIYRLYPIAEMLMKLNLTKMITEKALKVITGNKKLQKWIYHNAGKLKYTAFNTAYNAFKKNADPAEYKELLRSRSKLGRSLSFTDKKLYKQVLKYTTREAMYEYITKKNVNASSYCDYLKAADWLKLDFSDTKILFPRCFRKLHDNYTKQYAAHKNAELDGKMSAVAQRYNFLEWTDGTYKTVCAKTKQELITEGSTLAHCVGRMDYDRRQADGISIICFLRRCDKTDVPYVTVEVGLSGTLEVRQCYGYQDSVVHDVDDFVKRWMKHARAAFTKVKRQAA